MQELASDSDQDDEQGGLLEEALTVIEALQQRLSQEKRLKLEPIAIIGAGCRYPGGVKTPDDLWRLVQNRVDAVTAIPSDRWDVHNHLDPTPGTPGKMYSNRGGYLDDIELFDAEFFGIAPREAESIDPQQRLLLETAYEALESAGLAIDTLNGGRIGVFAGGPSPDFGYRLQGLTAEHSSIYQINGTGQHAAAGRISYSFGFVGPAVSLDTACSTSLVAVHLACQSLRTGETDLALAGGANILLGPYGAILFSQGELMSRDGACKTFDASADGFVRSEGCAVVALKRLSDAERDGDPILAVIRGTAVNSDGRSAGLAQPHGPAQEAVIRTALSNAGLVPSDIDYVEAHGTGTPIGDPIEVEALANVLGKGRRADRPLVIGSIKSNIGHPEAASGLAGLLKVVMSFRHEEIPATLHFANPNQRVEWERHPVRVADRPIAWPRQEDRPRRAGISSFGFSGTNAHVIVEEAPLSSARPTARQEPCLIPLSARTAATLPALAQLYADYLDHHPDAALDDLALTLGAGRDHHPSRIAILAQDMGGLVSALRTIAAGDLPAAAVRFTAREAEAPRIAFLFTGQGAQYAGMGRGLYEREPVFKAVIDRAARILDPLLDRPFLDVLFAEADEQAIHQTGLTQPALFVLQYALVELWRSWGVTPSIVLGHSVGEFAAACAAGVFGFEDGLRLVAARGQLMQALPAGGAMAAVFADEQTVADAIVGVPDLAIATVNSNEETVISGSVQALASVLAELEARGIKNRPLDVSHAFHSPLLDPMLDALETRAAAIAHRLPRVPIIANLTGKRFPNGTGPDAAYWRRHAREPVRFAASIESLKQERIDILLEIGPAPVLLALAARSAPDQAWATVASMRRGRPESREMLAAARDIYVRGTALAWAAMPPGRMGRRIALPTYPFQRVRHWLIDHDRPSRGGQKAGHTLLGARLPGPGPTAFFANELCADYPPYLAQHVVHGVPIMPGAGTIELMLGVGRALGLGDGMVLEQLVFGRPVQFVGGEIRQLFTTATPQGDHYDVSLRSAVAGLEPIEQEWIDHAHVRLRAGPSSRAVAAAPVADVRARAVTEVSMDAYYQANTDAGLDLGPAFRVVRQEHIIDTDEVVARLELSSAVGFDRSVDIHPILLDGAVQVTGGLSWVKAPTLLHIPIGVDEFVLYRKAPASIFVSARLVDAAPDGSMLRYDVRIEDLDGTLVATIAGLLTQAVTAESLGIGIRTHSLVPQWQSVAAAGGIDPIEGGNVLLIGPTTDFTTQLREAIAAKGGSASLISPEPGLGSATDLAQALKDVATQPTFILDLSAAEGGPPGDPVAATRGGYLALLQRAQTISAATPARPLCVVTRGAHAVHPGDDVMPSAAALVGLARTLVAEQVLPTCVRIDLDPGAAPDVRSFLTALGMAHVEEPELAIRQGAVLAPRLKPLAKPPQPTGDKRTVLTITERGDFDNLRFAELARTAPGPHEVEIEVRASGLNFRDLINALGMYPAPVPPLGSECAGLVTAVGSSVTDLAVGDEVVAIAGESFASHCLCPRPLVVRKPRNVSFAEAVTIPNAYLTAQLCLSVADLKPGQRVLVHAGAGGVGSAAIRLAKRAGLEVYATAGNPDKRAFAQARGAVHVFDSRKTDFADQILAITGGEGVDLVINSLAGDFIEAGLRIVKPGGCFVEIGKQGLWTQEQVAARAPAICYRIEDLGANAANRPEAVHADFVALMDLVATGEIDPLPLRAFPLSAAKNAFRCMANARHMGKIVLVPDAWAPPLAIRADGTYLVTGGLGGIGLKVVRWLVERGAGAVVILSRTGDAGREALVAELDAGPTRVCAIAGDVADDEVLARLRRETLANLPPLRGIMHAAGVVADTPFEDQTAAQFDLVSQTKVGGAYALHRVSLNDPLDVFALFSSTAALFGSPGQANYAAANGFLDGLAVHRHVRGLPAVSIAWGPWAEVGMASTMQVQHAIWERTGIGLIHPEAGLAALETVLSNTAPYVAVAALDLRRASERAGPWFKTLLGGRSRKAASARFKTPQRRESAHVAAFKALGPKASAQERLALIEAILHDETARVLGYEPGALDKETPLSQVGLDSLMAVQLRNAITVHFGVDLAVKDLLHGHSIVGLSQAVADSLSGAAEPARETRAAEMPLKEEAAVDVWEEGIL